VDKVEWGKNQRNQQQHNDQNDGMMGEDTRLVATPAAKGNCDGPCPTEHLSWLMKDPNHSAHSPELLRTFPDAKFIFTHWSPEDIVPSMGQTVRLFLFGGTPARCSGHHGSGMG